MASERTDWAAPTQGSLKWFGESLIFLIVEKLTEPFFKKIVQ